MSTRTNKTPMPVCENDPYPRYTPGEYEVRVRNAKIVKGGVKVDHFGGAKLDQRIG